MFLLSGRERHAGYGEVQWEDGSAEEYTRNVSSNEELIKLANTVELLSILKYYKVNIESRKCICPFLGHKGGRETSPSFYFYPDTNSFYCFGCKIGTMPVDFVSNIANISRIKAAKKILEVFDSQNDKINSNIINNNFNEKLDILLNFSIFVNKKISEHKNNYDFIEKIENIIYVFDKLNDKYDLDIKALNISISKIKEKIEQLSCQY